MMVWSLSNGVRWNSRQRPAWTAGLRNYYLYQTSWARLACWPSATNSEQQQPHHFLMTIAPRFICRGKRWGWWRNSPYSGLILEHWCQNHFSTCKSKKSDFHFHPFLCSSVCWGWTKNYNRNIMKSTSSRIYDRIMYTTWDWGPPPSSVVLPSN